jgi:hypothetical protein
MDYMFVFSKYESWKRFDDFIFENHCFTDKAERLSLRKEHVLNISYLARIIGKLEIYLNDRKDVEQAYYACKWFEKEFEELGYSLSFFRRWLAEKREIEAPF